MHSHQYLRTESHVQQHLQHLLSYILFEGQKAYKIVKAYWVISEMNHEIKAEVSVISIP